MKPLIVAMLIATPAHDHWANGMPVDPTIKQQCCGDDDCHEVPQDRIRMGEGGYVIELGGAWPYDPRNPSTAAPEGSVTVPSKRTLISPDNRYWICIWQRQVRCFLAPMTF